MWPCRVPPPSLSGTSHTRSLCSSLSARWGRAMKAREMMPDEPPWYAHCPGLGTPTGDIGARQALGRERRVRPVGAGPARPRRSVWPDLRSPITNRQHSRGRRLCHYHRKQTSERGSGWFGFATSSCIWRRGTRHMPIRGEQRRGARSLSPNLSLVSRRPHVLLHVGLRRDGHPHPVHHPTSRSAGVGRGRQAGPGSPGRRFRSRTASPLNLE